MVALAGQSAGARLAACILGEVMATSDVPSGVVNLLTGERDELVAVIAAHRDIDAVHAVVGPGGVNDAQRTVLRGGAAENVKRVTVREGAGRRDRGIVGSKDRGMGTDFFDADACESPWWIEPFVEMKTIWHPSAT